MTLTPQQEKELRELLEPFTGYLTDSLIPQIQQILQSDTEIKDWEEVKTEFYIEHDTQISRGDYAGKMLLVFVEWLKVHYKIPLTQSDNTEKWIDVKERLPEIGENVTCFTKLEKPNGFRNPVQTGHRMNNNTDTWIVGNNFSFDIGKVTHWQPLPQSPKEG